MNTDKPEVLKREWNYKLLSIGCILEGIFYYQQQALRTWGECVGN